MKNLLSLSLVMVVGFFAIVSSAASLTLHQAQGVVRAAAHRYIETYAPDWPGSTINYPCESNLSSDKYTVVCSGVANITTGSGGYAKTPFKCGGRFIQGHDGMFHQYGEIRCK